MLRGRMMPTLVMFAKVAIQKKPEVLEQERMDEELVDMSAIGPAEQEVKDTSCRGRLRREQEVMVCLVFQLPKVNKQLLMLAC